MERLLIIHWNRSTGPEPIIQYPPHKTFPSKELFLKIWAQHELNKESTIIELQAPPEDGLHTYLSILQEFENELYFLILVYNIKANPEGISPDILAVIGKNLLELINTNKITRAISEAFTTISNYSKLESEKLVLFFQDKIKYTILDILKRGVISKEELYKTLRQEYGFSTINVDLLLISFLKENLIKKSVIPGSKECYFLIKDLTFARIPPKNLVLNVDDDKIVKKYEKELNKLFRNYRCEEEIESKDLIHLLIDKDIFILIKTLRENSITINECLNMLNNREDIFSELLEKKIIFEAKGRVFLLSDVRFIKFTPYYLIRNLIQRYHDQEISLNELASHLKLLLTNYDDIKTLLDYTIL
jgi:hypothetical protein